MYHALLPEQNTKILKREYRTRFFIVLFFFVSVGTLVGTIFLLPSYLQASIHERQEQASIAALMANSATDTVAIAQSLSSSESLAALATSFMPPSLSPLILRIAALRPAGISIASLSVSYKNSTSASVTMQGKADTRNHLVAWKEILGSDAAFSNVTGPISDLAPDANLNFSLQMSATLSPPTSHS